jgi:hypothetical protein
MGTPMPDPPYMTKYLGPRLKHVEFETAAPRQPMPHRQETRELIEPNNFFPIYFQTHDDTSTVDDATIVVNGFNEPGKIKPEDWIEVYYNEEFGLCPLFAKHGRPAVLLPISFHYWRMPQTPLFASLTPEHVVSMDPIRFYLGYRQLLLDLEKLARGLLGREMIEGLTIRASRVHLVGFSLGGLGTLSAMLIQQLRNTNTFATCSLLFSGANLLHLRPEAAGIDPDLVYKIREHFRSPDRTRDGSLYFSWQDEEASNRLSAFERIVLGPGSVKEKRSLLRPDPVSDALGKLLPFVPVILGQMDLVNPPDAARKVLSSFLPEPKGDLLSHTVAGSGHYLFRDETWKSGGARDAVDYIVKSTTPEAQVRIQNSARLHKRLAARLSGHKPR